MWTQFLGYNPVEDGDNIMDTSFLSITRLDAWVATFVSMLLEKQPRGGGRQRDLSRLFHANYIAATYQFVGTVFNFVKYWFPSEVTVGNIDWVGPEEEIKTIEREATILLFSPVDNTYYIAVKSDWFTDYISPNVGVVHDCFIAKVLDDCSGIVALSTDHPGVEPVSRATPSSSSGTLSLPVIVPRGLDNAVNSTLTPIVYEDYDDTDDVEPGSSPRNSLAPETVPPVPQM